RCLHIPGYGGFRALVRGRARGSAPSVQSGRRAAGRGGGGGRGAGGGGAGGVGGGRGRGAGGGGAGGRGARTRGAGAAGRAQLMLMSTVPNAELAQLARAAEVLGWTPLAAPYTLGLEVAAGRPWAVALKLVITLATVALLLGWWARSLESAMRGAVASGGPKV